MSLPASFFASEQLHERSVELPDGSTHTLHFRQVPAVEFRKFVFAERSTDESIQAGSAAKLIAASLCDAEGKPAIGYTQALKLNPAATKSLLAAVMSVNGLDDDKGEPGNV
jgi:hypothetical protein